MNLKHIETCDFRRSEVTNFIELIQRKPALRALGKRDVVGLLNKSRTQIIWVHGFYVTNIKGMVQAKYIRSERLRMLDNEKWNPLRVEDYSRQAGFAITNFEFIDKALAPLKKQVDKAKKEC